MLINTRSEGSDKWNKQDSMLLTVIASAVVIAFLIGYAIGATIH